MSAEWIKTAKVGDKVVAYRSKPGDKQPDVAVIKAGEVFTIRDIKGAVRADGAFHVGLLFEEIRNVPKATNIGLWEPDYNADCFRPVSKRPTDITIFTDMLKPVSNPVHEEA